MHEGREVVFFNDFDDRTDDCYYANLSDMGVIHECMETKIKKGELKCNTAFIDNGLSMFCIVNKFNGQIVSVNFFKSRKLSEIDALVTYAQTSCSASGYIYNIGYHVKESLRIKGLGKEIVKQSIYEIREFFKKYGGNIRLEPSPDDSFLIEAIVSKDNIASNKIASKILNSHNKITECIEKYSQKESYVYSFDLFNT